MIGSFNLKSPIAKIKLMHYDYTVVVTDIIAVNYFLYHWLFSLLPPAVFFLLLIFSLLSLSFPVSFPLSLSPSLLLFLLKWGIVMILFFSSCMVKLVWILLRLSSSHQNKWASLKTIIKYRANSPPPSLHPQGLLSSLPPSFFLFLSLLSLFFISLSFCRHFSLVLILIQQLVSLRQQMQQNIKKGAKLFLKWQNLFSIFTRWIDGRSRSNTQ